MPFVRLYVQTKGSANAIRVEASEPQMDKQKSNTSEIADAVILVVDDVHYREISSKLSSLMKGTRHTLHHRLKRR